MFLWGKASARDKERAIMALSEIRNAQTNEYNEAGAVLAKGISGAFQEYSGELQRIDKKLGQIEHLASIVLSAGENLSDKLSRTERRNAVNQAREKLDEILKRIHNRQKAMAKQRDCDHEFQATGTEDDEADGHTRVLEGNCKKCELPLPIPSNAQVELEQKLNEEPRMQFCGEKVLSAMNAPCSLEPDHKGDHVPHPARADAG